MCLFSGQDRADQPTVLALYNPQTSIKIYADASYVGLGAVLLQATDGTWKPVAYASRSLSETQHRFTQIEEALAVTWACEKFTNYIVGRHFKIEFNHKPLIPLLNCKHLVKLPPLVLQL